MKIVAFFVDIINLNSRRDVTMFLFVFAVIPVFIS